MKKGIVCLVIVVGGGLLAFAPCYNSDGPDCVCFNATAPWNPSGTWIQDVALDTVGTIESCVSDGGKPFYQMRLGLNSSSSANSMAAALDALSSILPTLFDREAWCSETISYWHREAGIPYSTGYRRSSWHLDWQLTNTEAIRTFYRVEELIGAFLFLGGRGRWIEWSDLNYLNFQPGINAPAPGSYVLIRAYDAASATWTGNSHSMMIDEMTIYKNGFGDIVKVEVSLLDGNAGSPGRVRDTASLSDLIAYTPAGPEWLSSGRKILGFGIDLDRYGSPVFDPTRLHYRREELAIPGPFDPFSTKDPMWSRFYEPLVHELADYAVRVKDGPRVTGPSSVIGRGRIPDGQTDEWVFEPGTTRTGTQAMEITIDLLQDHPLLIKGLVLRWEGAVPLTYGVRYAAEGQPYQEAATPGVGALSRIPLHSTAPWTPIGFGEQGARVRMVQFTFPQGAFSGAAKLMELRFIYDWGPGEDAEFNPLDPGSSGDGPLSISISASASAASEGESTHVLIVSWRVSGGTPPYRLSIEVTEPSGATVVESEEAAEGTKRFELTVPDGGTAHVRIRAEDAVGDTVSGMADVSLSPL